MKFPIGCKVTDGFNSGTVLQTHGEYSWVLFDSNRQEPTTCLNMTLNLMQKAERRDHFNPIMGGISVAGIENGENEND